MSRFVPFAAAVLLVAAASGTALADDAREPGAPKGEHGEKRFPALAAEFRAHVEAREARGRAHLEERIARDKLPAADADRLRAAFEAGTAKVHAKLDEVCADGSVTREEAHQLHAVARESLPHDGHGEHHEHHAPPAR